MRFTLLFLLIGAVSANAQMRRRTTQPAGGAIGGVNNQPAATMHGTLKKITSKDIIIVVEGDQAVTIDRTHKTKFLRDGKDVKPADILVGSVLTIDVSHDPQLAPLALTVTVDSGPIDQEKPPAMTVGSDSKSSAPAPEKPAESPNQ